jgi:hypothetical protein
MPQTPTERTTPLRATILERILAAITALACLAVLIAGASIKPSPQGHGTHESLGLPPCAWVVWFDKPCATCGMTTAVSHATHASFLESAKTQPMGFLIALTLATIFWGATHQALTASRIGSVAQRAITTKAVILVLALILGAWMYKAATWN